MIPQHPNWSSITNVKPYPQTDLQKPHEPSGVAVLSLGPAQLNNSQGVLNARYWLATQEAGQVFIRGSIL